VIWDRSELNDEFASKSRTGATGRASFSTRRPGEKRSRRSTTRSRWLTTGFALT